jgi:hypothetical protein
VCLCFCFGVGSDPASCSTSRDDECARGSVRLLTQEGQLGLTLGQGRCTAASMSNRGFALLALLLSGCYTTKVYTPAPAHGPELQDRQWFTIGGLVPLSDPAGQECPGGVARAESKLAFVDVLINVGLAVAGGVAGAVICSKSDGDRSACGSAGAGLVPFLFASRTVQYTCGGSGASADQPVPFGATATLPSPSTP